jgi:LPS-assembly protein
MAFEGKMCYILLFMKNRKPCCLLFSLLLAVVGLLSAQSTHEDPIVYADQKTIGEDALRAAGHVEVFWQDYVIYADAIDFNLKTRELFAEGRVTMTAKDLVLSGEKLIFNLKTQRGELRDAYGLASPVVRFQTDRLEQTDRETLAFQRLDFSSCAQIVPRWSIRSRKGRIKKEKYIAMHDVLLRIKKIPVFYLPYMRYPLQKDGRATGLLFPGLGNSSLRGFFVQNALFWAIRPNIDMTIGIDYFSKLGVGVSDELRYLFRAASGSARFYYFKYRKDNGVYDESAGDYYVEADHLQSLPFLNSRLVLNINSQSRPGFLRLLDNSFDRALMTNFQTAASLTSSFANMNLALSASRRETYYISRESSQVVETLPALSFNLNQQKLGRLPGYFSLAVGFQNIRRGGVSYELQPDYKMGFFSQRLAVTPSYQLPLFKLPWLNSTLDLSSKNLVYAKSYDPVTEEIVDKPLYLKYHTAELSLKGPAFSRIFGSGKGGLKHIIEPEFRVGYSTRDENVERLVKVDRSDYPPSSYARFSLTTRLLGKGSAGDASSRELLSYIIGQSYFFDPAAANLNLKIDGEYPSFSELSNRLRFNPLADMNFDATADYNYYIRGFTRLNLSASYQRPGAPLSGSLSYSISRNAYAAKNYEFNRTILGGSLNLDFPSFPLKIQGRVDYDFTAKEFRHGSLSASFDYQCLVFSTECKVFTYYERSEFQFRFGVSLGNLGMVGDFFGGK